MSTRTRRKAATAAPRDTPTPPVVHAGPRTPGDPVACRVRLVPYADGRPLPALQVTLPDAAGEEDRVAATCVGMVCAIRAADAVCVHADAYTEPHGRRNAAASQRLRQAIVRRCHACGIAVCDDSRRDANIDEDPEAVPPPSGLTETAARSGSRPPAPAVHADRTKTGTTTARGHTAPGSGMLKPAYSCADAQALPPPPPATLTATEVAVAVRAVDRALCTLCGGDDVTGTRAWVPDPDGVGRPGTSAGATTARATADGPLPAGAARGPDPLAWEAACRLSDLPHLFEQVLRAPPRLLDAYTAALVIWCMDRPASRDIAILQWCGDRSTGQAALRAQLRWEQGEEYPLELGERMWGEGPRPDLRRIGRALALVAHCAELAPSSRQAGALAACAWLSWVQGRPDHAERYASRACSREPDHGLGEIVRSFITVGHVPHWSPATPAPIPSAARAT